VILLAGGIKHSNLDTWCRGRAERKQAAVEEGDRKLAGHCAPSFGVHTEAGLPVRNNPLDGFEVDTVGDNGSNDQIF
jgi:hypothetical protein